jgi:hypothetical protein
MMSNPQLDYFNRDAVAGLILARLPREAFVTQRKLQWALMRRQPLQWVPVALVLALMLAMPFLKRSQAVGLESEPAKNPATKCANNLSMHCICNYSCGLRSGQLLRWQIDVKVPHRN